ncbi:Responsible for the deiodination of T4 (3,5,3',5'- tetraiodothyronine) [Balamuthia mandrillaris]
MNQLAKASADVVDFIVVYIAEAHAADRWPLGRVTNIKDHRNAEDRLQAAKLLKGEYGCEIPIYVDSMNNNFDDSYAVWPERFFIVHNGRMALIGYPTVKERGYDRSVIAEWIQQTRTIQNDSFSQL